MALEICRAYKSAPLYRLRRCYYQGLNRFLQNADGAILPGVGSFADAMDCMKASGLTESVIGYANSGKPFLGICLGLQLLFEASEEALGRRGWGF